MRRRVEIGCLLVVAASWAGCRQSPDDVIYTVGEYDPARDPQVDLVATVSRAQADNKRILLQVGGPWCGWCHRLDTYIATHPAVTKAIGDHFIIMKVNYSDQNENAAFLEKYPKVAGYPHLYVLDTDGTILHSQGTAELEEGDSYSESAILEFLNAWKG
jgi:thioredoxin-related protein